MNNQSCHGVTGCLEGGSSRWLWSPPARRWQKFRSYAVWHFENLGFRHGLKTMARSLWDRKRSPPRDAVPGATGALQETLALQPGELVEVKPIEEILATLDRNRRHKGLLWMTGMREHCGRRYRVYRRVQRITLESNGELRTMKNTVLLEGVMCDGREFGGCDRSCFHFWREAWLKRVVS